MKDITRLERRKAFAEAVKFLDEKHIIPKVYALSLVTGKSAQYRESSLVDLANLYKKLFEETE